MGVKLAAASGGSIELVPTNTASSFTVTVPAVTATVLTDSAGILNIGSGQIYKDASGNVGIGTSSPAAKLDIISATNNGISVSDGTYTGTFVPSSLGGMAITTGGAYPLIYYINGAERARIDSSGNLLVGTTSGSGRLYASLSSSTVPTIVANNQFAGSSGLNTFYSSLGNGTNSVANTNCYHLQAVSQGSAIYYLYGNGTTSFTSDQRLKKNIETTRNGYAQDLCKLRVVKYQWNTEPDDGPKELGLIAQEVEQVFPGLVQDAADEIQGIKPKVLKASVLPLMLLKAIQEQQALIVQLQADVAALKGAQA